MAKKKTTTQETQKQQTASTQQQATTTAQQQTGTSATTSAQQSQQAVALPDYLKQLMPQVAGVSGQAIQNLSDQTNAYQIPPETLKTLQQYASGDYLFGGAGQEAFTNAAMRAASPGIFSAFGSAGRAGGGLEHTALSQAGIDAFARLFPQEQQYQLQAAQALPGVSMLPLQLQQQLAQAAGAVPGQFAPLYGQTGSSTGQSNTNTTSSLTGSTNMTGSNTGSMSGSSMGVTTEPIYETPWWQTALGAAAAIAPMAIPGAGGISAIGSLLGATPALAAGASPAKPGLLGFR